MSVSISVTKRGKETDDLYLSLARDQAKKSKCLLRQVGAIITRNGRILATGYNGIPFEILPCSNSSPCMNGRTSQSGGNTCNRGCIGLCAEQFAIIDAAKKGMDLNGATVYCTHSPCIKCAMIMILVGIAEVVYEEKYPDDSAIKLLEKAGVEAKEYKSR
jgi:dCMP deaminase